MKQRLSKLALLAVAAAFIVAGFPACSEEEEPDPPAQASATFAGVEIPEGGLALTAGEPKDDVTATLTVANTAFSDAVKDLEAGAPLADYITLSVGEKVSVAAKLTEKVEGNTMKITLSVTADADAEAGTGEIKATLKAAALTAAKDVPATGVISYTVKAADPGAPKATLEGDAVELTKGDAKPVTATVTMTQGTFAETIAAEQFALKATDSKVTVTVTAATKTSATAATLTLSVTAADGAANGTITATVKAEALADYDKAIAASGTIAYTVKDDGTSDDPVYFTSFVASDDLDKTADSTAYETLTSKDGLVTMGRTKYQEVGEPYYTTIDYDEEAGKGYTYTARVKVNKTNNDGEGKLTIKSVKVGAILRIDGGNASSDTRKMSITGADETLWEATTFGSFYLKATAETVVLESLTNEFCIYGIHVVDEKVEETVVKEETTYVAPTLTLSATSVVKGEEVTVTATIPEATKTITYSTGKVESEKVPVNADITYNGATVTDGKVDTSAEGTLTITASYTMGEGTYTSEAVTLEVTGAFAEDKKTVTNDEATLGLVAATVASADESIATAEKTEAGIVITSKKAGTTTITASDGTKTATIVVTVKANGKIETDVRKYAASVTVAYDASKKQFSDTAIVSGDGEHHKTGVSIEYDGVTYTAGYKMESTSEITLVLSADADIYFAANGDKTLKTNSNAEWAVNTPIENVKAGTYKLTSGSGKNQTSVCAVVITYK